MKVWIIPNWGTHYETADGRSKKLRRLSWVQLSTQRTKEQDRLRATPAGRAALGTFYAILMLAGTLPVRGWLASESGPYEADDLAVALGIPVAELEADMQLLTSERHQLIQVSEWIPEEFKTILEISGSLKNGSGKLKNDPEQIKNPPRKFLPTETETEKTGQNKTEDARTRADAPPPPAPSSSVAATRPVAPTPPPTPVNPTPPAESVKPAVAPVSAQKFLPGISVSVSDSAKTKNERSKAQMRWQGATVRLLSVESKQRAADITCVRRIFSDLWPEDSADEACGDRVAKACAFAEEAGAAKKPMAYLTDRIDREIWNKPSKYPTPSG